MRFLTLFPNCENVHLVKDVGMVPYCLHKFSAYDSTIASYKNGDYPYLNTEVEGLKQVFIVKKYSSERLNVLYFLMKNAKNYDVLQLYHFSISSLIYLTFFKLLKSFSSIKKTYLKLDADDGILDVKLDGFFGWLAKLMLSKIDLISVECKVLYDKLKPIPFWNENLIYMPNGFYTHEIRNLIEYEEKQNIVLTVGRIGSYQKANEFLMEAFAAIAEEKPSWMLQFVGPIEKDFNDYIKDFFINFPNLKERVVFFGSISDRVVINDIYKKAKIFSLTSRYEGFPLVFLEAMRMGCTLISSDVSAAYDVIENDKYGRIFKNENVDELIVKLRDLMSNEDYISENCLAIQNFVYENFYWPNLVEKINAKLI